jgi:phage terminase large subunit-like protein
VLNYYNQVTHYTKQKALIKAKHDMYDPIRVGIEANGYQLALLQDMRDNPDLASIRAVPVYTETDKTVRAWKLSAYFERGQVFLLRGMNVLQQHLLQMPDGRYKDLFDALDIAVELAFSSKRKVRDYEPGII